MARQGDNKIRRQNKVQQQQHRVPRNKISWQFIEAMDTYREKQILREKNNVRALRRTSCNPERWKA